MPGGTELKRHGPRDITVVLAVVNAFGIFTGKVKV